MLKYHGADRYMTKSTLPNQVVVYIVKRHPLESADEGQLFRWLQYDHDFRRELEDIIGPYDAQELTLLIDDQPAGRAWEQLLHELVEERIRCLVTHLAPLSSAQRQQLIGVCAEVGTQLITPSDAGRNRASDEERAGS